VNTDLPVRLSRAVDLGCHEGYPGHHVLNVLLEQRLTRARGWVEFSVYPLYSPQSLIAEGSANYGIALAFPGQAKTDFERDKLYPLAGLDPKTAAAYGAVGLAVADPVLNDGAVRFGASGFAGLRAGLRLCGASSCAGRRPRWSPLACLPT